MKIYVKATDNLALIPILHIYVDVESVALNVAASSGIDFDNLEIFSKNKSIARRFKKSDNWLTPVIQLIRRILKSMDERNFNLIKYKDSGDSYTYYIKFQPADEQGKIINQELILQIELRDHVSKTHADGAVSDTFSIKAYYIEDKEYPDTVEILTAVYNLEYILENTKSENITEDEKKLLDEFVKLNKKFDDAMEDDFNTADAITAIFDIVKVANSNITSDNSKELVESVLGTIRVLCDVLGLKTEKEEELLDSDIEKLIEERQAARKNRDFARADEIRDTLLTKGIVLEDTREGVRWKRA